MKDRKKRLFPDYELIEKDDIRTIPDFYDNLYPSFENSAESSLGISKIKPAKKREKRKNSENP